jgi:hypothetical protein
MCSCGVTWDGDEAHSQPCGWVGRGGRGIHQVVVVGVGPGFEARRTDLGGGVGRLAP